MRQTRPRLSVWTRDWAQSLNLKTEFYPVIDSTNSAARRFFLERLTKSAAAKGGALSKRLFIAETQTAGRGQNGKTWLDSDLTASFLWITEAPESEAALKEEENRSLTEQFAEDLQAAGLAVWPSSALKAKGNDLMRKGKKIAGILLELVQSGGENSGRQKALIAGLGMNVFSHPPSVGAGRLFEKSWAENRPLAEKEWRLFLNRLNALWTLRSARFLQKAESPPAHRLNQAGRQKSLG